MKRTATFVIFVDGISAASALALIKPADDLRSLDDLQITLPSAQENGK